MAREWQDIIPFVMPFLFSENYNHNNMLINILNSIFGEQSVSSNRQFESTADVNKESVVNNGIVLSLEDEVLKLAELHGPLAEGVTIELSLQQALSEFPRKRHRSDSFSGLIRKVKKDYGTNLIITGRKAKIAPKSDNS